MRSLEKYLDNTAGVTAAELHSSITRLIDALSKWSEICFLSVLGLSVSSNLR